MYSRKLLLVLFKVWMNKFHCYNYPNMKAKYYIYILFSLFCFTAFGQPDPSSNWKKNQKIALEFLAESDFQNAANFFSLAAEGTTGSAAKGLYLNAASCYEKVGDFWHARNAYKSILDNSDWDGEIVYNYSKCQYRLGNYKDALSNFKNVLSTIQGEYLQDKKQEIKNNIAGCELALALRSNNTTLFEVSPLNTNVSTYNIEYNPVISDDNVLRFSREEGGLSKMYFGNYLDGNWSPVKSKLQNALPEKFAGSFSLSPDGNRVYFSTCSKRNDGSQRCAIYHRQLKNGVWSEPERLPDVINKPNSSTIHPFIYTDKNKEVLLFCSNRTDGEGGTDIWFSVKTGGEKSLNFSEPQNLGIKINTAGDETTPFYAPEKNTLYFSSNGQTTVGGFDVFKARGSKNSWDRPQNMGFPINSSADDLYFNYLSTKNIGFLVSNRTESESEAQNNDDIYSVLSLSGMVKIYGDITDEKGNRLNDVDVAISDLEKGGTKSSNHFSKGQYSINLKENHTYQITVSKPDFEPQTLEITAFNFNGIHEIKQDVTLAFSGEKPMITMVDKSVVNTSDKDQAEKLAAQEAAKLAEQERLAALEVQKAERIEAKRIAELEAKEAEAIRIAAELKAKKDAEKLAAQEAAKLAEQERLAALEVKKAERVEAERIAELEAKEAEAIRIAAELKAKKDAEKLAAQEAAKLAEQERLAALEVQKAERIEAERIAELEAKQAEEARIAAELKAKQEAERLAAEKAKRLEQERIAALEAKRKAELEAKQAEEARIAAELKAKQEAERLAAEKAKRLEQERITALEAKRKAELEAKQAEEARIAAELKAKQDAERLAAEKAKRLEQERIALEAKRKAELEAKQAEEARIAAELKAKQEAERLAAEKIKEKTSTKVAPREKDTYTEQITDSKGKYKVRTYEEIISDVKKNKELYNRRSNSKEQREDATYEENDDWR